jgi:peptidyl-prolyl cis-trans isomerase B (cyclophilin B)
MKRIVLLLTALITLSMLSENQAQSTKVRIKTSVGDITLMLYDDTPIHKDNILELIKKNFYDGITFHRVIPNFMIQGGDPTTRLTNPQAQLGTIPAEFLNARYHKKGALCAARTGGPGNPKLASSGSQFYIVTGRVWTAAELDQMEASGSHPKFTDQQRKDYTTIGGYPPLDYTYSVYGEVTEGLDIAEKISNVERGPGDKPKTDIRILSFTVVK